MYIILYTISISTDSECYCLGTITRRRIKALCYMFSFLFKSPPLKILQKNTRLQHFCCSRTIKYSLTSDFASLNRFRFALYIIILSNPDIFVNKTNIPVSKKNIKAGYHKLCYPTLSTFLYKISLSFLPLFSSCALSHRRYTS